MAQGSALVYGKTRSRGISMHRTSRGIFYKILVVATIIALLMSPVPRAQAEPMTITAMLLTTALAGAIWGAGTYLIGIYILGEPFDVVDMLGSMVFNACLFMAMLLIPIIPAPAIMTSLGVQVITNQGVAKVIPKVKTTKRPKEMKLWL